MPFAFFIPKKAVQKSVNTEKHAMELFWFLVVKKLDRKLLAPSDLSQILSASNIHVLYLLNNKWKHNDVRKYI